MNFLNKLPKRLIFNVAKTGAGIAAVGALAYESLYTGKSYFSRTIPTSVEHNGTPSLFCTCSWWRSSGCHVQSCLWRLRQSDWGRNTHQNTMVRTTGILRYKDASAPKVVTHRNKRFANRARQAQRFLSVLLAMLTFKWSTSLSDGEIILYILCCCWQCRPSDGKHHCPCTDTPGEGKVTKNI